MGLDGRQLWDWRGGKVTGEVGDWSGEAQVWGWEWRDTHGWGKHPRTERKKVKRSEIGGQTDRNAGRAGGSSEAAHPLLSQRPCLAARPRRLENMIHPRLKHVLIGQQLGHRIRHACAKPRPQTEKCLSHHYDAFTNALH